MRKLAPPLIEKVFLEILKPAYLMVAGQYGLGRDGLFRADCLFPAQADCIVGLESNTPRINTAMAVGAGCLVTVNLKLFADRKLFKVFREGFGEGLPPLPESQGGFGGGAATHNRSLSKTVRKPN